MNCKRAKHKLLEYAEHSLPSHERNAIEAHLKMCADCRAEAHALERAENALRGLSVVETAPDLAIQVRRRVARYADRGFPWAWAGAGLAAAVLTVVLILLFARPQSPVRPSLSEPAPAQVVAESPSGEPTPALTPAPGTRPVPDTKPTPRAPRQVAAHRTVRHPQPPETVMVAAPSNEPAPTEAEPPEPAPAEPPQAAENPLPETAVEELAATDDGGIVFVLGEPLPVAVSSSYVVEVTFSDGARSLVQQTVERDATGRPRAIQVACKQMPPEGLAPNEGGTR